MTTLEIKNDVLRMIVDTNDKAALKQIKDFLEESEVFKINETAHKSNGISKQQVDFARQLIQYIKEQHFEYGITSAADELVSEQMTINALATQSTINDLFVKNHNKPDILVGLLQIISRIPVEQIHADGYTIVTVAIAHENLEVKETAIRCLENWGDSRALEILKSISVDVVWLQDYLNSVINDIQEELCLI